MSSPTQQATRPVASEEELVEAFRVAGKPRADWRVGIEHEKLGIRPDGRPVPYHGQDGIAELLRRLEARGFSAKREDGHAIALDRGGERITVEPGGQLELSGTPLPDAVACAEEIGRHLAELRALAEPLGMGFVWGGFRPFGALDDVEWLPKRRYTVMRAYLPGKGRLAHEMMKRTATVQVNLDFGDEDDATDKIRTAYRLTSVVTALFASSPISDGRPNGHKSWRAAVWLETDEERCGLLPFAFSPGFRFRDYVEWALDVPMFFVERGGEYRPAGGATFRRFLREGLGGERATLADWELHLSTVFPEVRLKRTIELRGADAAPLAFAKALPALWRGILDDPQARAAAAALGDGGVDLAARETLRREVPKAGLAALLGGRPLHELAVELVGIAAEGLRRLPGGDADRPLLEPLADHARAGRCPADDQLADFAALGGDPARLVERWRIA
jgi:glutamate--cysteine ligase